MSNDLTLRGLTFATDLAAHETRRKAIVESGDGLVLDWLLKAVGGSRCNILFSFCVIYSLV